LVGGTDSFLTSPWFSKEVSLIVFLIFFWATGLAVRERRVADSDLDVLAGETDNFPAVPFSAY